MDAMYPDIDATRSFICKSLGQGVDCGTEQLPAAADFREKIDAMKLHLLQKACWDAYKAGDAPFLACSVCKKLRGAFQKDDMDAMYKDIDATRSFICGSLGHGVDCSTEQLPDAAEFRRRIMAGEV